MVENKKGLMRDFIFFENYKKIKPGFSQMPVFTTTN